MNIVDEMAAGAEEGLKDAFHEIDKNRYFNQIKVLDSMRRSELSESDFNFSSGYGYGDRGRDKLEKIYADVFDAEDALVRHQIVSGTHAISTALFANLRPGDLLLSVYGHPYDTLHAVIGIGPYSKGSLREMGVNYDYVPFEDPAAYDGLLIGKLKKKPAVCLIQRSKGYSERRSLPVSRIRILIEMIKKHSPGSTVIVDNCYGEFVEKTEPSQAGADLTVGSLIKNPGGGLAPCGGYIVGKKEQIENCEYRMTCPGLGREVGPSLGFTRNIMMGLFFAPHIVSESLKGSLFCCELAKALGYKTYPEDRYDRTDIVQSIVFGNEEKLTAFCQSIQKYSPVDSFVKPFPWDMPGYQDKVIMAAGTFTQGSSIELSCDAPLREPYIAYLQGGLFYDHTKYAVVNAFKDIIERGI
jgi:cystathionine beta-lyase family protein involved in aluminum resistance